MPRHMPSRDQKRTNILTILGVIVLLLLIVALINSYFVHQRMLERKQKDAAEAAASASALQSNIRTAKQKNDLAAKQAAAALKATQSLNSANAITQNFQATVEETQNYTAKLNDIMTRWFGEYSDTQNDNIAYRGAHVANLIAIYNELASYKVPKGLQDTKSQLLGEMATALDRLNIDPATHQRYVGFEHDDADTSQTLLPAPAPSTPAPAAHKAQNQLANIGVPDNTSDQLEAAGQIGAGFFSHNF